MAAGEARLRELRGARMAMIFQEPMTSLNPVMSCGAQIDEVFRIHTKLSSTERRERTFSLLQEVALPEPQRILGSYPHQLSGGQRQRIMIAMALALEPALLIADEPTTALDVTTQAQILKLIAEIQRRHGMAVLFITHDFGVVADIAHRVAVLQLGVLVELGAAAAVLRQPKHEYTRMLIASVPSLKPRVRPVKADSPVVLETRGSPRPIASAAGSAAGTRSAPRAASASRCAKAKTLGIVGESARASPPWRAASCG